MLRSCFVNPDHIVKCHLNTEGTRIVFSGGEGHLITPDEVNRVCANSRHRFQNASSHFKTRFIGAVIFVRISVCQETKLESEAVDSTGLLAYRLDVTSKNY